ncbi:MAG: hypothetical protein M5U19_10110 [Microthrixaceae bacterium]|nr:hypothetical protein [Microthrixaceae bacterium]
MGDRWGCRPSPSRCPEPTETVEDVYEPYLIQQGLLQRTPGGGWPPRPHGATSVSFHRHRRSLAGIPPSSTADARCLRPYTGG